jgi:hypothetical protein
MKSKFLFPVILVAGLLLANFSANHVYGQTPKNEPIKQITVLYMCSMHPEVVQDQPGNCPKCGMKLVEKKDMPKENIYQAHDTACMKHEPVNMMTDTACMKHEHMKMMPDSTIVRKDSMMHNTKFMEHQDKDM